MDFIMEVLINTIVIVGISLVCMFFCGLIIELLEKKANYYLQGAFGYTGIVITGLGTVVHELSHLLMAILGRMKIEDVKLFRPIKGRRDGVLGYVKYSYSKRNYYHKLFLLFVGVAPIFGGTLVILISLNILLPTSYNVLVDGIMNMNGISSIYSFAFLKEFFNVIGVFLKEILNIANFSSINFWIFIFITLSVSSHMSMSMADIKGAVKGIPTFFLVMFLFNIIFKFIGIEYDFIYKTMIGINFYIIMFLCIAIIFSIFNTLITMFIYKIVNIIKNGV